MKTLIAASFVVALGFAVSAQAMPLAPVPADDGLTVKVAQGCGPGRERGPGGRCHFKPVFKRCPPGMHRGYLGRCRPN